MSTNEVVLETLTEKIQRQQRFIAQLQSDFCTLDRTLTTSRSRSPRTSVATLRMRCRTACSCSTTRPYRPRHAKRCELRLITA